MDLHSEAVWHPGDSNGVVLGVWLLASHHREPVATSQPEQKVEPTWSSGREQQRRWRVQLWQGVPPCTHAFHGPGAQSGQVGRTSRLGRGTFFRESSHIGSKFHLSGLNCSGWSHSSGSVRNFFMLVMAMLPSGTTCPVGNVVWGTTIVWRCDEKIVQQLTDFVTLCITPVTATTETLWTSAASKCEATYTDIFLPSVAFLTYGGLAELKFRHVRQGYCCSAEVFIDLWNF